MTEKDIGYERTLNAGEVLFREGDKGDRMYLIKSGKIRIVKEMDEMEKTLAVLNEGAFFGEMSVLDNRPRSASAIAETDTELIIVDRDALLRKVNENPFIKYIIGTLTDRLRKTDDMLKYYSVSNEKIRFMRYLKDEARGKDNGTGEDVDTGLNPEGKEIADMIGLTRDEIRNYLKKLEKYGIVEIGDTIIVKTLKRLKKYEEFISLQEEFEK
ncbi:Crp/Fnr family transcriptional regulator [candidate division WOR-3 bacterium]|nr:Crp/Fnr family transcriptional regulator [candidate division WOR-3 bacterium]